MKYRWLLAITGAVAIVLVVLTFRYPYEMLSPGALIPAHSGLTTDCFACHSPLRGASAERCISCHTVTEIGLRTTRGETIAEPKIAVAFHQDLVEQDCIACHIDHSGARLAHNPHKFTHELLQPQLREQCESCHVSPQDEIHHDLASGCAQCHSAMAWKPVALNHAEFFELDRDHDASCVTCHVNNILTEFTCYGCHEHSASNIRRRHEREDIRDFENCVECHRNAHDDPEHGEANRDGRHRGDQGDN